MNSIRIHKILVPVDFSESSLNALEAAVAIAKKNNAQLCLVHVRDNTFDFTGAQPGQPLSGRLSENADEILNALAASIHHQHSIKPGVLLKEGLVSAVVVRTALEEDYDLVVMGTHGASGYREHFIGTNTYQVIKHAHCPVLTIPAKQKAKEFKKILFPVKPIPGALKRCDLVLNMANANGAHLQVLCLSQMRNEEDQHLIEFIADELKNKTAGSKTPLEVTTQLIHGHHIADNILTLAEDTKADLVVLTPSLDMTNKHFFIGPYTQKVVSHARMPVLTIKRSH